MADVVVQFISKSDRERARLIREARALYDSIFPSEHVPEGGDEALTGNRPAALMTSAATESV